MAIHKLYKDGSIGKFNDYIKAIPVAVSVAALFFYGSTAFFLRLNVFLGPTLKQYPNLFFHLSIIVTIISFIIMLKILMRPLFSMADNKLTYYEGLFSKHTYQSNEIKSIQISSDEQTITLDIRNIGGLSNTIDMRSVGELGTSVKSFLDNHTEITVIALDEAKR